MHRTHVIAKPLHDPEENNALLNIAQWGWVNQCYSVHYHHNWDFLTEDGQYILPTKVTPPNTRNFGSRTPFVLCVFRQTKSVRPKPAGYKESQGLQTTNNERWFNTLNWSGYKTCERTILLRVPLLMSPTTETCTCNKFIYIDNSAVRKWLIWMSISIQTQCSQHS
jgi:hypothetical protein